MPLSLRHLDLFRLLMQVRNVTETARLQRVSQPAVSLALKALEAELGIKLFLRRGGHIIPTVESHALLREVERLFQQLGAVENRAMELRDANAGHLAVGSIPTLAGSVCHARLRCTARTDRALRLTMNGHDKAELTRLIRLEELDMALAYSPVDDATVVVDPIMRTAMLCLLPRQHVLANKKNHQPEPTPRAEPHYASQHATQHRPARAVDNPWNPSGSHSGSEPVPGRSRTRAARGRDSIRNRTDHSFVGDRRRSRGEAVRAGNTSGVDFD